MSIQFVQLRKELEKIKFESVREDRGDYFEAVAVKDELAVVISCLEASLGSAVSPAKLPKPLAQTLKEYGGIRGGQRLYCKFESDYALIILFWPWADGAHTTIKIIDQQQNT